MRRHYTATLCLLLGCRVAAAQQPFARLGVTVPVLTLSNGRYPEYFANDSLRRIGSVVYNRRLHRIAYLLPADSLTGHAPAQATSRWLSTDPITEPFSSPYVYVNNTPVYKIDPDGRSGIASIDKTHHTITISSTLHFYGTTATPALAKSTAASIQAQWNNAHGKVKIDGVTYQVQFKITGVAVADNAATQRQISTNSSLQNNYIRLDEQTNHGLTGTSFTHTQEGGNTGYWSTKQNEETKGTTGAHEYGHGLNLRHHQTAVREEKDPDIMMTEYNIYQVAAKYLLYNPTRVDLTKRKVIQDNIDQVFTPAVRQSLQQRGTVGIGKLSNTYEPKPQ